MWEYSKVVVKERTEPQHLAELRNYLRMEFGLGTEPGISCVRRPKGPDGPRAGGGRP